MRKAAWFAPVGLLAMCLSMTACSSGTTTGAGAPAATIPAASSSGATATSAPGTPTTAPASTSGSRSSALDVCSLMSAAQASSINSVTYTAAEPKHVQPGYDTCVYHNSGQHSSPIDIQDLTVTVVSVADCWTSYQQADGPGTAIAGLGDGAFGYEIGIDVKAGARCLEVSGLTAAEFRGDYQPDTAMANIILAGLR